MQCDKSHFSLFSKKCKCRAGSAPEKCDWGRGMHKQFSGCTKTFFSNSRVKTIKKVFITKYARNSMNSGMKTEKRKGLRRKACKFWGEDQTKKRIFIAKSAKNGLAHEHWVEGQYFGGVRPRTAANSSGTKPVTFFGTKSSLGGHISCLGMHKK